MLTAKSPYPAGLSVEDLIELKSSSLPDMSLLPAAAPITLLRQILESESRNRPKSLMEWDRALQRFIRFTPNDTSRIAETQEPESVTPPAAAKPITPFVAAPVSPKDPKEVASEPARDDFALEKAKVHTQRLSLELTKRVQKELALTAQLKELEEKLESERTRVQELTARHTITPSEEEQKRIATNKAKVDDEWQTLRTARKKLDREQNEFLKKTQRFSVSQLKSELDEAKVATAGGDVADKSKPRSFWFSRRPKEKEAEKEAEKEPALLKQKAPVAEKKEAAASTKPERQTKKPEAEPKKEALADSPKVEPPAKAESPAKAEPPAKAVPPAKTTAVKPSRKDTPFSIANPPAEKAAAPSAISKPSEQIRAKIQPSKPKKTVTATKKAKADSKPPVTTSPVTPPKEPVSKRKPVSPPPRAEKKAVSKPVIHQADPTSKIPTPSYQPLPGAWLALVLLAAVITLGLFLAYRTFFSQQEDFFIGGVGGKDEPAVIEFSNEPKTLPAEEGTDTIVIVSSPDESEDPNTASKVTVPNSTREAQVNEEIRVDMKAFENFLLLQDQEWAELLHSLKTMQVQADRYTEEEMQQIRQELFDDLERAAQLKKDSKLMEEPGFRELFDHLKPLVKSETAES